MMGFNDATMDEDELHRLQFITETYSKDDMLDFAERALTAYVMAAARMGRYSKQVNTLEAVLREHGKVIVYVTAHDGD